MVNHRYSDNLALYGVVWNGTIFGQDASMLDRPYLEARSN